MSRSENTEQSKLLESPILIVWNPCRKICNFARNFRVMNPNEFFCFIAKLLGKDFTLKLHL